MAHANGTKLDLLPLDEPRLRRSSRRTLPCLASRRPWLHLVKNMEGGCAARALQRIGISQRRVRGGVRGVEFDEEPIHALQPSGGWKSCVNVNLDVVRQWCLSTSHERINAVSVL